MIQLSLQFLKIGWKKAEMSCSLERENWNKHPLNDQLRSLNSIKMLWILHQNLCREKSIYWKFISSRFHSFTFDNLWSFFDGVSATKRLHEVDPKLHGDAAHCRLGFHGKCQGPGPPSTKKPERACCNMLYEAIQIYCSWIMLWRRWRWTLGFLFTFQVYYDFFFLFPFLFFSHSVVTC